MQTSCAQKPPDAPWERFSPVKTSSEPKFNLQLQRRASCASAKSLNGSWFTCGGRTDDDPSPVKVHPAVGHSASQPTGHPTGEDMSPLFMDAGYEINSPGSVSAEGSNTAGSEREGEGPQMSNRGRKRQEKNRDAARKSRKKQTERADQLHEELQCLERSNSALKKEIATLKKDFQLYTTALDRHKPFCRLKDAASSSPSADCPSKSSPPGVPPQASSSIFASAPSLSTSLTSSLSLQTHDCVESTSSAPPKTPRGSPTELFTSSSSINVPFSTALTPHSLFSEDRPLITSRLTDVPPVCTSLASSSFTAAAQPGQGSIHESSSMPACFSPLDEFLITQASFLTAPPNVVPLYTHLAAEITGQGTPDCHVNEPQLQSSKTSPPCSLLPPNLEDPARQASSVQSAFEPSYSGPVPLGGASLLSMLTVPSPPNVSTSSSFDGLLPQPPPSLPLLGGTSKDLSFSELLEGNDWILSGNSHQ